MFANFDRYTGQQVGTTYTSRAAAQSAKKGFRCITLQNVRGEWVECL